MSVRELLLEIQKTLRENATPEALAAQKKFVPGVEAQKVYGVRVPVLNDLAKQYKAQGFELAEALWKSGAVEEKMLAAKLLRFVAKKDPKRSIRLVETFSGSIRDWAVCDTLGMQSLKPIFPKHVEEVFTLANKLNSSKNLWQRRLSLVLVEWYTWDKELHPRIEMLIQPLETDKEYYVKKAIVWIRKNFGKGK